jgi:hypothetical protein
MSKYAPAREDGLKPWIVTLCEWGRKTDRIIYAETNAAARYQAVGRMRYVTATARRATPADIAANQ